MSLMRKHVQARVVLLSPSGIAVAVDFESGREYSFGFNKIRNYGGETASELGLAPGTEVQLVVVQDQVETVDFESQKAA